MFKLLIPPFPLSPASCPSCHPLPFPFSLIWCFNRWINDCFYSELLVWEKRRERETEQNTEWNNRHSLSETMCRHLDWINLHPKRQIFCSPPQLFSSHLSSPSSSSITLSLTIFSAFQPVRPRMFHLWPAGQIRPSIIFIQRTDTWERSVC